MLTRMNSRFLSASSALVLGSLLAIPAAFAQTQANQPASPYGGATVEGIIARVNDQIITQSDYNRAMQQLDDEGRQRGQSMQEISEAHKDLLRNLIDQQLWLSKGKELGITGETELIKKLDEIRKQYNMSSMEDLEQAAKEQGVSFEDFKANIRNQIITQSVMRQQVGQKIQPTPGETLQYYEQHKQDYVQPESERLSEILVSTGDNPDDAKVAAAKAKADDLEARLHAGGDFAQLARSFSDGPTAAEGGDLGQFRRGALAKVLEDKTFALPAGQSTDPIRTRQGWVILKVTQHTAGGAPPYKDVQEQVEEALYMSRMEPAIRAYLNKMRDEAAIFIKPGYQDSAATEAELHPSISFSAYVPPSPKKKSKVERTRFRESTHTFRQKGGQLQSPSEPAAQSSAATGTKQKNNKKEEASTEKPGKREKIRYGQAPRETLPTAANGASTENAGALPQTAENAEQPANPLEPTRAQVRGRFSDRAREEHGKKKNKQIETTPQNDGLAPPPPTAAEVADQQTQSAPLGLGGNTTPADKKKKKTATTTSEKTRMSQKKKEVNNAPPPQPTPVPPVPGAPAPARNPEAPQPQSQPPQ